MMTCQVLERNLNDEQLVCCLVYTWWNTKVMNDPFRWFRVAIHKEEGPSGPVLRFEHPTQAAGRPGGWMEVTNLDSRSKRKGG